MRKIVISLIIIFSIALLVSFGWYFFLRDTSVPIGETVMSILPFGSAGNDTRPTTNDQQLTTGVTETGNQSTTDEFAKPTADLFRISDTPVAGFMVLKKGNENIVRYVDRTTGHIYDVDLATLEKTKIHNQTLPKIYEAYFRPDGNAVLLRSLKGDSDVVENLSLTLTPPKATLAGSPQATSTLYAVSSTALRGNISVVTIGSGNTLFYALRDTSSVVSSAFNGTGAKTLFTSAFIDWRLVSAGNNLVIFPKASANTLGNAYILNTSSGALKKIAGPFNGLIAIPNSTGNQILYSYFENNKTRLFAKNLTSEKESEIFPATLVDKCVWSTKEVETFFCGTPTKNLTGIEPDNWYRGLSHFSDYIWRFDSKSETAQLLSEPKKGLDLDIDAMELKLSSNEDYLIFKNKTDLSIWALKLEQS